MYLTAEDLPSDRLRELAQHYTSGISGPELQSFFSEVLQSNEVWKIGFLLISSSGISQEQFFGLSILNGAIRASSYVMSDEFTAEVRAAILRVVEDNTRMSQVSRADIRNSVLKKAFELLAQMLFRIEDFWSSPINDMFDLIGFDKTGSYSYILSFLTILLEEFVSTNLPFHMNGKVKQLILNSESLVFDLFQKLMASQSDEDVLIQVMTCCSTWISSLSVGSGALECSGLISLIYQTMSRSESLYLTGLDCLILLFEATGCGLSSGRITVKLLDFHIFHLAALRNNMNNLRQAHAAAVENGLKWEEFEQCIPLTKSILLLHTFVEKQADQLVVRVLSSSELACPLRDLLEMFLIPLSVRGHYPRDEVVSEYGAPIWFNLLDAVVTNRLEHQTESIGFQLLMDIQIRFLNAAFLKCHYPSDTNAYFLRWSSEEREEWHKSRSELGDNFMMAYSHQYSMDWFNELHENLSTVIVSCEFDSPTFQWQRLEAMLFILRSIHDQVSYEVAHENKASFQCALTVVQQSVHLISRLQPVLLGSTIEPRCDEWATGHCLLSCTLFDILCEYPPTLLSSELPAVAEYPTRQWCGAMLYFILSTFNGLPHLRVHREVKIALLHSTLKFFQIFIQNLPGLEEHTDSIVAALDVAQQLIRSDYPSLEPAIWYIFGLLMSHRALVSSIEPVMYSQIDGILALCESHASANDDGVTGYTPMAGPNDASQAQMVVATLEHSMQRLTTLFVEFFSGVTKALAMLEQCGIESRSLSDYWQVRRDASRILLFLMKTLPVTANTNENPEWINQFARLIQSGIRVCDPSSDRTEYAGQILDCAVPIVEKILGEKSAADTPVLDLSWLLLDALLQEARQQNRPNGFSTCLRLLSSCFHLIELAVVHVITGLDSALSVDHFTASVIEHPISPFLLAPKAQEITEHLSVSADFLYRVFSWPITRRAHFADAPCQLDLFCLFEAKMGLPRGHCWKISLTVGLAGLCVPEWITVQSCIRLLQSLFTRLIANEHSELWDVLFTPDLLFQIHASLVVVFAKGTLPRRLVNKYAYLYAALSPIMPDKQFSLLHALVGATSVPPSWFSELLRESPHNQYIYYLVDQAVRRSTVAERGLFVHSVTRTATPVDQIKNAIDNFSNACAGYTL